MRGESGLTEVDYEVNDQKGQRWKGLYDPNDHNRCIAVSVSGNRCEVEYRKTWKGEGRTQQRLMMGF